MGWCHFTIYRCFGPYCYMVYHFQYRYIKGRKEGKVYMDFTLANILWFTVTLVREFTVSQGSFSGFQPAGTPYDREHQPGQPSVPVMVGMQEQYIPGMGAPIPVFFTPRIR